MIRSAPRLLASAAVALLAACAVAPKPSEDFFEHVNHRWLAATPVPAEYSSYGVFHEIHERNQTLLRTVLEEAAERRNDSSFDRDLRLVGTFWASGMDEARVEALGLAPLRPELERIAGIRTREQLVDAVGQLHRIGVDAVFGAGPEASLVDPQRTVLFLIQGGLSLPERDYYLSQEAPRVAMRGEFERHVARTFVLLGLDATDADADAARLLRLETALAEASLSPVEMRDLSNLANELPQAEAEAVLSAFPLRRWQASYGLPPQDVVNLASARYFEGLNRIVEAHPLDEWRAYLRYRLVSATADYLPRAFVEEDFAFARVLTGAEELQPRWKRVLGAANAAAGEAVGKAYVARAFTPRAKQIAETMVADLLAAYRENLETLPWMGDATKAEALAKLAAFGVKIGYPDEWQDYSQLRFEEGQYLQNALAAARFATDDALAKVGKPTDPDDWGMTPQTVNAYYHPMRNEIVFPAGIMQPPFFSEEMDLAANYGAMGAIIGHEITHGFDDQGSQFDADGVFRMWWTEEDRAEFMRRAQKLVEQADAHEPIPGVRLNGQLTLGENIADLGGVKMAYRALQMAREREPIDDADGLTPEQRFFRQWAIAWRENSRPEAIQLQVTVDPHATNEFRCNAPLSNLPEFARAWSVPEGAPMARPAAERVEIW
jgi:putative endopeptidase